MSDETNPNDPPKKPAGNYWRKRRREESGGAEQLERARRVLSETGEVEYQQLLDELGDPPLDAIGGVSYAHRAAQALLAIVLRDRTMTLEAKLRWSKELIGVIGLTTAKAVTDEELSELKAQLAALKRSAADATDVLDEHPSTGRGAGRPPDGARGT